MPDPMAQWTRRPASACRQLGAVLIRNYHIKRLAKRQTLTEVVMPLYFVLILIVMRLNVPDVIRPQLIEPQVAYPLTPTSAPTIPFATIAVINLAPSSSNFSNVVNRLKAASIFKVVEFATEEAMLNAYFTGNDTAPDAGAFKLVLVLRSWNASDVVYTIRVRPEDGVPSMEDKYASEATCRPTLSNSSQTNTFNDLVADCPARKYYETGFAALQAFIDSSIIATVSSGRPLVNFTMSGRVFPKEAFRESTNFLRSIVPMYMVLSFTPFVSYLCILIVGEKEKKLKIAMKLMGLRESVYWLGWFITFGIMVAVISLIVSLLLVYFGVLRNANVFLIFVLFTLYGFSTITFGFLLTPFFNKAKLAGGFASLSTSIFSLFYFLSVYMSGVSTITFYALSLLSPTAFALGLEQAISLDLTSDGLRFNNFWQDGYCFGSSVVMLSVDVLLYGFLAFYFDNVIPGEYGHKRRPWFLCLPSFWLSSSSAGLDNRGLFNDFSDNDNFEKVPPELIGKEAIRIFNLRKVFTSLRKPEVVAIENMSLDIYEGQITAILGHNGAGKTTLLNILAGVTTATEGTATIYGLDIEDANNFDQIWQMVGLCPQQDVIFETLTPKQHLEFFGRIKNVRSAAEMRDKIHDMLMDVDLIDRIDTPAGKLSGGQKRKLSIAIALIGDPKILILDEPTSGVDPYSRRRLWNVLQKTKAGRVVLLTTHFMDEADLLADRKAIVSNGIVKCAGSSLFLKNRFGLGYHLTMVIDGEHHDVDGISQLVRYHVVTRKKIRSSAVELAFLLPSAEVGKFSSLMSALDEAIRSSAFGIRSYGISMTTLEEVFLKLGEDDGTWPCASFRSPQGSGDSDQSNVGNRRHSSLTVDPVRALVAVDTSFNCLQAFLAVFKVHVLVTIRMFRNLLTTVVIPIALLVIYFIVLKRSRNDRSASRDGPVEFAPTFYQGSYSGLYSTSPGLNVTNFVNAVRQVGINFTQFNDKFSAILAAAPHTFLLNFMKYDATPSSVMADLIVNYNDTEQHSLPIVINTINNVAMKLAAPSKVSPRIRVFSDSLPIRSPTSADSFGTTAIISVLFGFLYVSVASMFAAESVEDREMKVKHQLQVSGLPFHVYWSSKFAGNLIVFCLTLTITIIVIEIFQVEGLSAPIPLALFGLSYLLFIVSVLPYGYCMGYMFDKYETAQSFMYSIFLLLGVIPYLAMAVCDALQMGNGETSTILHFVFTALLPLYIPFAVLYFISKAYLSASLVPGGADPDFFTNNMAAIWIALPVQAIVWWAVLWLLDYKNSTGTWAKLFHLNRKENASAIAAQSGCDVYRNEDDDVKGERERVHNLSNTDIMPVLVLDGLRKVFASKRPSAWSMTNKKTRKYDKTPTVKVAVRNLSFAVNEAEVFGLLGPNGAGKSTALKMIVAEESSTSGKVIVAGHDMSTELTKAIRKMGYCPQHDALWKNLTLREHLECYAAVRGIRKSDVPRVIYSIMTGLQILGHASKKTSTLSGGTKRKLSFAISMLGNPKISLLDEPSTGMDPQSKRYLWDTITASFLRKRGAILTTHSMEEADVLCSRVGIMVRGELRCVGSTQHLKNKYGSGYTLESKVMSSDGGSDRRLAAFEKLVARMFENASVSERFEDRIKYHIPQTGSLSLANIFSALEKAKEEIGVEEYSFSQTTLEQVFLDFAKEQEVQGSEGSSAVV